MPETSSQKPGSSPKAKALAARLAAVQALYEYSQNQKPASGLIEEYLYKKIDTEIDGQEMLTPDGALLKKIVTGVTGRQSEVEDILKANLKQGREKGVEPLLKSILMAGIYEIVFDQNIDFPIIINDYLHVAHSFYPPGEVKLVNGVLDAVAKLARS